MAKYDLEKYKEFQAKVKELHRYIFVVAKPIIDADYQAAVNSMSAHCSPYLDPLEPDPFDADVEMLHSIGYARGMTFQMLDFVESKIQTFIDLQESMEKRMKPSKKKKHHRY